jgi:hypothetical protein
MGLTSRIAQSVDVDVVFIGSMELVSHRQIARFLDGCDAHGVHILGMEGFRVDGVMVRPDMGAILDCSGISQPDRSRAAARSFIERMGATELAYEFVFREE